MKRWQRNRLRRVGSGACSLRVTSSFRVALLVLLLGMMDIKFKLCATRSIQTGIQLASDCYLTIPVPQHTVPSTPFSPCAPL